MDGKMGSRKVPESVEKLMEYDEQFKKIFDTNITGFAGKLCILGIPDFDVIAFGAFMEELGWRRWCDGSLAEYIEENYGVEGKELIDTLIELLS